MKKIITLFLSIFIMSTVMAENFPTFGTQATQLKSKPLSIAYAPDPTSANIGNAFNFYAGLGSLHGSNLGFSLGADYEFPIIDPNLTVGPQVGFGVHHYGVGYFDLNGVYHTGTAQLSFSGGVVVRYYADWLIPDFPDAFDVFVMSTLGFSYVTYSSYYSNKSYFDAGFYLGGRWNFKESMSLYAQVGSGTTNISVGLSIKM